MIVRKEEQAYMFMRRMEAVTSSIDQSIHPSQVYISCYEETREVKDQQKFEFHAPNSAAVSKSMPASK